MLRGSLAGWTGENVEQVEVDFAEGMGAEQVVAAWKLTVENTAALRSGFVIREGEPCGMRPVAVETAVRIETRVPASWEIWRADDRRTPLPLDGGLPWRAVLWPDARKWIWTFHHALLDGRSITKILVAFQARLIAAVDSRKLELAIFTPPAAEEVAAAADFHRRAFAAIEAFHLNFPDVTGNSHAHRCLGADAAARLESAARRLDATTATLLTWAWGQTVACAAGADAVAVGQVRSGPPRPGQAGFSMNTVPLVIRRAGPDSAEVWLREFRQQLLAMRAIESVSPQDLPAGIFQETGGPWPGGIVMVERGSLHHQVGKSEVIEAITLHELGGEPLLASAWIHPELRLEVEVNSGPAAAGLLDHWAAIVTAIADEAADPILLPAAMREVLAAWENGGEAVAALHLATAWHEAVGKFSDQFALWTPEKSVSYAELAAQVEHLAARLHEAGVKPGQPVANLLDAREHLACVVLALARLGAIHVPLDPALPENRLRIILEDSAPLFILSDQPEACASFSPPCIRIDGASGNICPAEIPDDPRETLALLYTSGSTGRPKGVMMVHGGVVNEAHGIANLAGIGPGERVLQFASPGFDASLEELLATLLSGATMVPRPEGLLNDLDEFQNFIRSAGITVLDLSTAHWAAWCAWMVSENEVVPPTVKTTIIGGERASAAAMQDWFAAGGRSQLLVNTYGPTEASIVATAERIRGDWDETGDPAIGRPLPGVFARVADSSGRSLPCGAAGELWLGGICIGPGYWQRPDLTAAAFHFIDGRWWYRTGDRVYHDRGGNLRFLGRQDEQLKIRGNRVEPNEVVRVLESMSGVSAAQVGLVRGHGAFHQLAAWVRWDVTPEDAWPGQLAAFAAAHLPIAAIPTRWAAVEDFKLTERGKLDRSQLPDPMLTASTHGSSEPPATPTEERLAKLWGELLGVETIGRDESFFELGGHSLAALQLFAGIAREWRIRIPMATLIHSPTPRLLGEVIDQAAEMQQPPPRARPMVLPIRQDGHLPPLFCIHGGDGGVFFYRDLAGHLSAGRPLLAIESPALAAHEEVTSVPVEETATSYLNALRHHQPRGPFHLAGYSYGGLLVYEMARQLIAEGEAVAFAGLFDTVNPATPVREYSLLERAEVFWESQDHPNWLGRAGRLLARTREGIATHFRVKEEIRAARNAGSTEPHSDLRMLQVREAHWESMENYKPAALDCHVTLFKSQATDDKFDIPGDYGWSGLVKSLEIVGVKGKHLTMFAPKHIGELARKISKRL